MPYDLTIATKGCSLLHEDSGKETYDFTPNSINAAHTQTFICDWGDRNTIVNALIYAAHPVSNWLFACTFAVEPVGKPSGTPTLSIPGTWTQARITVGYKNLPFLLSDYKEITSECCPELVSFEKEGLTFPGGSTAGTKQTSTDSKVYINFTKIKISLHNQATFNETTAASIINNVNSAIWTPDSTNTNANAFPIGQVLYLGYDYAKKISIGNAPVYDVTYNFLGSEFDHRKEFNIHTGDYQTVQFKQSGNPKYAASNFTSVLGV